LKRALALADNVSEKERLVLQAGNLYYVEGKREQE